MHANMSDEAMTHANVENIHLFAAHTHSTHTQHTQTHTHTRARAHTHTPPRWWRQGQL